MKMTIEEYYKRAKSLDKNLYELCTDIEKYVDVNQMNDYTRYNYSYQYMYINDKLNDVPEFKARWTLAYLAHYDEFKKIAVTITVEYNPIENYDRTDKTYDIENERTQKSNVTPSALNTLVTSTGNTTTENYSTTYDNLNENLTNKTIVKPENLQTNTTNTQLSGESAIYHDKNEEMNIDNPISPENKLNGDIVRTHESTTTGNIGVTTTQEMLQQERKIAQFNFMRYIVETIIKDVCVGVL